MAITDNLGTELHIVISAEGDPDNLETEINSCQHLFEGNYKALVLASHGNGVKRLLKLTEHLSLMWGDTVTYEQTVTKVNQSSVEQTILVVRITRK